MFEYSQQRVKEDQAINRVMSRRGKRIITTIKVVYSYSNENAWFVRLKIQTKGAKRPSYETVKILH